MALQKIDAEKIAALTRDVDIQEESILRYDRELLGILLKDQTTKKNIIWATADYKTLGKGYEEFSEIIPELITGEKALIIQPRITKSSNDQNDRIRDRAEVFTPSWLCNRQNNLIDSKWFGRDEVFNYELESSWIAVEEEIKFNHPDKTWGKYIDAQRLEITCGEAPYIVSRYDTVTGERIPLARRIGLLDRKLRIINENTYEEANWLKWAERAFQSVYGYEFHGDSLLLARENLLFTFIEYFQARFDKTPSIQSIHNIARIISWNIWQMDGIKFVVPYSCKSVLDEKLTFFGTETVEEQCPGCKNSNAILHNGSYCKIKDWRSKTIKTFISITRGEKSHARI